MKILAIEAGCAECHFGEDGPLIETKEFESLEAAKAYYAEQQWLMSWPVRWEPHPQGGEHVVVGQGSVWLRPA